MPREPLGRRLRHAVMEARSAAEVHRALPAGYRTRSSTPFLQNEAGGGQPVSMILRSETRVDVRVGSSSETVQAWHRCTATTS